MTRIADSRSEPMPKFAHDPPAAPRPGAEKTPTAIPRHRSGRVRLAVISTPRSGNTWFRFLLHSAFGLEQHAVHNPDEIDWANLPERYVLQLHWSPSESLRRQFTAHDIQTVTLARHPLGVLISILHYVANRSTSARWLEGAGGDESSIVGALPRSGAFLRYATGSRAQALLAVSADWWNVPGACRVRYEELVADPLRALERLATELGVEPVVPLSEAIDTFSIKRLREVRHDQHAWRGDPDLWKTLLPAAEAQQICAAHSAVMQTLGYQCDADAALEPTQADLNWLNAEFATLWDHIKGLKERVAQLTEAEQRRQLGWLGRLKLALSVRYPRATAWIKSQLRGHAS